MQKYFEEFRIWNEPNEKNKLDHFMALSPASTYKLQFNAAE